MLFYHVNVSYFVVFNLVTCDLLEFLQVENFRELEHFNQHLVLDLITTVVSFRFWNIVTNLDILNVLEFS